MNSTHTNQMTLAKVLYVVVCAAPPAAAIHEFVSAAQAEGWEVCAVVTHEATKFVDVSQLEALTTHPIRIDYRAPGEKDPWPGPDAIAVVPATFNTINKWAQGIADTLAVGLLCEHMGRGIPIVAVPCLKDDLARHPAFAMSMRVLKTCGIRFLYEPEKYLAPAIAPWSAILEEVSRNRQEPGVVTPAGTLDSET